MGSHSTKPKDEKLDSVKKPDKFLFQSKHFHYLYSNRNCIYRAEQLEISPKEDELIQQLTESSQHKIDHKNENNVSASTDENFATSQLKKIVSSKPIKIILDTDIGTDIDDKILDPFLFQYKLYIEVICVGITTNYHPTLLRKYVAESILKAFGKDNGQEMCDYVSQIPVYAGSSFVCGTHREYFHAGNEGLGLRLSKQEMEKLWAISDDQQAENCVDFIYNTCAKYPKQVTIVSIGMELTDSSSETYLAKKKKMHVMFGCIKKEFQRIWD
ncbi:inosine-uridine preferring nucleoside hydrolase [Reticulomyxa filosa]|uniref:Inosine-uridine preferring nucleoside hydrolase n=1 Tax=Reticulomyxa filosa TaxID=46433 RepID=X6NRN9_RETFI|nr:inosine-uridine preferring nucleoside hydrolase [Reticulomyxa filosa]|eukprot:ETO28945.1 inosine-uridine preferring nucleoside hydrolase [Reticulomyxa filosa]